MRCYWDRGIGQGLLPVALWGSGLEPGAEGGRAAGGTSRKRQHIESCADLG
jgi:hypothetical protein